MQVLYPNTPAYVKDYIQRSGAMPVRASHTDRGEKSPCCGVVAAHRYSLGPVRNALVFSGFAMVYWIWELSTSESSARSVAVIFILSIFEMSHFLRDS